MTDALSLRKSCATRWSPGSCRTMPWRAESLSLHSHDGGFAKAATMPLFYGHREVRSGSDPVLGFQKPAGTSGPVIQGCLRMREVGLEPTRDKIPTRPSTWRVCQFRHSRWRYRKLAVTL